MSVSKSSQCLYLLRVGSECLFAYHGPLSCTWKWLGRVGDQDHLFEYLCEPRRGRIGVFYDRPVGLLIELFRLETGTWDIPYLVSVTGKSVMVCPNLATTAHHDHKLSMRRLPLKEVKDRSCLPAVSAYLRS